MALQLVEDIFKSIIDLFLTNFVTHLELTETKANDINKNNCCKLPKRSGLSSNLLSIKVPIKSTHL